MNLNWYEIDKLVEQGYIKKVTKDGLSIYNYTKKTQYEAHWTNETETCRGLIVDEHRNIIALPFKKIFNWMEGGRRSKLDSHIITVTEKLDGQLGIMFQRNGKFIITTRGTFDSPQAQWASKFLYDNYYLDGLSDDYTLLFEIISPQHRVIIDYKGREDLVLLAARNKTTGEYLRFFPELYNLANAYGFSLPKTYQFNKITDIIEKLNYIPANEEGYVVEFKEFDNKFPSDGQRFKFKGDRYLELHKLICGLTFKKVLIACESNSIDSLYIKLPEEFHPQIHTWIKEIDLEIEKIMLKINKAYSHIPSGDRKTKAMYIEKHHSDIAKYLFNKLDSKSNCSLISQEILNNRGNLKTNMSEDDI